MSEPCRFHMSEAESLGRVAAYDLAYAVPLLLGLGTLLGAAGETLRFLSWFALPLLVLGAVPGAIYGAHLGRASARRLREDPYDEWAFAWVVLHYLGPWAPLARLGCWLRRVPCFPQRPDWSWRRFWQAAGLHMTLAWELVAGVVYLGWALGAAVLLYALTEHVNLYLWVALGLVLPLASVVVADVVTLLLRARPK